ncbi:MAG: response regulator [Thermoplasmatota archaeon]
MVPRILVVDDDADILSSMCDVLTFAIDGALVQGASSGRSAMALLRENPPDALVTDYRMPGMDGLQLAEAATASDPGLPVIMVTAFNDREVEARAEEIGVRTVLHKPFALERLVAAVQSELGA